jgi:hypothetical protein
MQVPFYVGVTVYATVYRILIVSGCSGDLGVSSLSFPLTVYFPSVQKPEPNDGLQGTEISVSLRDAKWMQASMQHHSNNKTCKHQKRGRMSWDECLKIGRLASRDVARGIASSQPSDIQTAASNCTTHSELHNSSRLRYVVWPAYANKIICVHLSNSHLSPKWLWCDDGPEAVGLFINLKHLKILKYLMQFLALILSISTVVFRDLPGKFREMTSN